MKVESFALVAPPMQLAYLDNAGIIVEANEEWKEFARKNRLGFPNLNIGRNYLDHCGDEKLKSRVKGLLSSKGEVVASVYPCPAPPKMGKMRWLVALGFPFRPLPNIVAVIMHVDVTAWVPPDKEKNRHALSDAREYTNPGPLLALQRSIAEALITHFGRSGGGREAAPLRTADQRVAVLSTRQRQVLLLIGTGMSNIEIAHRLSCSLNTVKRHVTAIFQRLNLGSRTQAALLVTQLSERSHGRTRNPQRNSRRR